MWCQHRLGLPARPPGALLGDVLSRRGRGGIFSPVIHGYLQPDGFFLHRSIHHAPFGGLEVRAGSWACRVGALSRPLGPSCGFPKHFGGSKQVANVLVPCPLSLDKPEHGRPRPHGGLEGPGILRLYGHVGFFATVFCAVAHLPCTHIPVALPAHALPPAAPRGGGGPGAPGSPPAPFQRHRHPGVPARPGSPTPAAAAGGSAGLRAAGAASKAPLFSL